MRVAVIDGNSQFISGILGSISNSDLLNRINTRLSQNINTNFTQVQDIINKGKEFFVNNIVNVQEKMRNTIKNTIDSIFKDKKNVFKPLIKDEDYEQVPLCMYDSILAYKPIRNLHKEDRIFGFGMDASKLSDIDPYERMINNGKVKDVCSKVSNGREIVCISTWDAFNDPNLTLDEIDIIEETRMKIDELLERKIDPTDYPNSIG